MKASQISRAIINLVKNRQPLFLWGPPGVGKSQIVKQAAEKTGLEVRDVRAVLLDPVDLRGIPNITPEGLSRWCAPSFLPREGEGILFLDELNTAPPLVQAACYQLILDRKIGEYSLPDGWAVIAAGNRDKDRAVTHKMPSALANRFVHIDFTVDMDEWLKWAEQNGIAPEIIEFLKFRPNLLHDFTPEKEDLAFPTPRSWEFASNLVSTISDEALLTELLEGTIGKGATVEFMGFQRIYYQLPEIQKILTSPTSVAVPTDPAILFATCELTGKHASLEYAENLFTFAERLPEEFGVLLVREAVRNCSEITSLDAFSAWAACNSDILV
ncbi:MAG: ATPase [Desulfobacterales bacterium]|nr:MAG: ATPase [Desulfobacterales bacterium]